ncbi:MAG: hypothetical protein ACREBU_12805, partial [Nitrososphaera sp.]
HLFIAAIIPDLDFLFYEFLGHHAITHSITFWSLVYMPFFVSWRTKAIPYYFATLSHLLGDLVLGNPPLFYGISDQQFGFFYQYSATIFTPDQFMLFRSLLELSTVILLLVARKSVLFMQSMFSSYKDVTVVLPILIVLVVSIFIASHIQDKVFFFGRDHDWPIFIGGYSILAISHLLVLRLIVKDARQLSKKEYQLTRKA